MRHHALGSAWASESHGTRAAAPSTRWQRFLIQPLAAALRATFGNAAPPPKGVAAMRLETLESRVLVTGRQINRMDESRILGEAQPVDAVPRPFTAPELTASEDPA